MKKLIALISIITFIGCNTNEKKLTSQAWYLYSTDNVIQLKDTTSVFKFNDDGTFLYKENHIPKGEEVLNKWELSGKKLKLKFNGVYINKESELIINISDSLLQLQNFTIPEFHHMVYVPENSVQWFFK